MSGFKIGHWTNLEAATGCSVVLCEAGAVCGVDVRGGAPGTRETDLLHPTCTVDIAHAVLIGGGSAFGLAAADGVMRWLEERGHGFDVGVAKVPIVPAAILFDLMIGDPKVRPDAAAGYAACEDALARSGHATGNVGAGAGATVGKALGPMFAMKGGLGFASHQSQDGLVVSALVAVNAFGNVHDLQGNIIAGARHPNGVGFADRDALTRTWLPPARQNTTLGVVMTNAKLTKAEVCKLAQFGQNGLVRVIHPINTPVDGDVVFALAQGAQRASIAAIGMLAAEVMSQAVINAVMSAETLHGVPAAAQTQPLDGANGTP